MKKQAAIFLRVTISLEENRPPLQVSDAINTIKPALTNENHGMFVFKFGVMLTHLYKNMFCILVLKKQKVT